MLRHGVFQCIIQVISVYKQKYAVAVTEVWSQGHWRAEGQIQWITMSKAGASFEKIKAWQFHVHHWFFSDGFNGKCFDRIISGVYIQGSSTGSSKQRSPSSWSALSIASDYTSPTRLPVFTPQLSNWFPCAWPGTKDFAGISIDQDTLLYGFMLLLTFWDVCFPNFHVIMLSSHIFFQLNYMTFSPPHFVFFADFKLWNNAFSTKRIWSVLPRSALRRCYSCAEIWWGRVKNRPGRDHRTGVVVII